MAGIYIHIPFCRQACTYCNFHFSTTLKQKDDLLKAIMAELDMQKNYLPDAVIETIYFGGGTPSLLSGDEINMLADKIMQYYGTDRIKEFTLEANPDDLSIGYLKALRKTPVNRLSIGVQSFRNKDLQYMHRAHNAAQADYAVKAAQDAGFDNLSIDLIYGTPGLTDNDWKENIARLASLDIPHFSAYALTVEEGTALHHMIEKQKTIPVDAAQAAGQFEILMEQAAILGYDHYEISNFAKPGRYAMHNTNYWMAKPYLGIGPSAHSFNGTSRRWNIANNALYIKSILGERALCFEEEQLTPMQHLNEYIMTSLRTIWGLDMKKVEKEWGSSYADDIKSESATFKKRGWLAQKEHTLVLTNEGKLYADRIASDLFFS